MQHVQKAKQILGEMQATIAKFQDMLDGVEAAT